MRNKLLTGAAILTAGAMLLLTGCGKSSGLTATTASTPSATGSTAAANPASAAGKPDNIYITVEPGTKLGSDGKLHDAFINGDITMAQGVPVTLNFYNYDSGRRSYTAPALGLNVILKGSPKKGEPGVTAYSFTPEKTGTFKWRSTDADGGQNGPWAMTHDGYMMGAITVVPQKRAVQQVSMVVNAGFKLGSDGKLHDAYTPGDITVNADEPVELKVYNFDKGFHTFLSPNLGLSLTVKGSTKQGEPAISTITFTPHRVGVFEWNCVQPCDGQNDDWSMGQDGYMMGTITVK